MKASTPSPMQDLQAVLANFDHEFDEPESIHFIAKVRENGILVDHEWQEVLKWLDYAMTCLREKKNEDKDVPLRIDDDPRNADWIRIVRAQRIAGYRMPHWAALWLWWIGYDREEGTFWIQVGAVAKFMEFQPINEVRRWQDGK